MKRLALLLVAAAAHADCPKLSVAMTPSDRLQIVAWIEDATGQYVDTIFMTESTGFFGLGNRPGAFGFKSGPLWPYGKRLDVFPIWAHRHGLTFPEVVFQNPDETNLSRGFSVSSREPHYCRPILPTEPMWDLGSCATTAFTDKGDFSDAHSLYPPRSDLSRTTADSASVPTYEQLNPFDAISRATPQGNAPFAFQWLSNLPKGNYVLRVEVSKEFDQNASYNDQTLPSLMNIPFGEYGMPYRGQPSVVYDTPFVVGDADSSASTATFAGYGDPDGLDGTVRAPDGTIETTVPGSGAARLLLSATTEPYRVRVDYARGMDVPLPEAIDDAKVKHVEPTTATIGFTPANATYDIRIRAGELTEANFASSKRVDVDPVDGEITIDGLQPRIQYTVGIRPLNECLRAGPLTTLTFTTPRQSDEVGCCNTSGRANAPLALLVLLFLSRGRAACTRRRRESRCRDRSR